MTNNLNIKIPQSIGIIMDGNRRFAKAHGLPQVEGHRLGYSKLKEVATWCQEVGIKFLTVYAFSTENWNRSKDEVSYLVDLFKTVLFSEAEKIQKEHGAIRFIGEFSRFSKEMVAKIKELESNNPTEPNLTLVVALSYGGRLEILTAINKLIEKGSSGSVTEEYFSKLLWSTGIPDPDLIIRVGGEKRLSNFLTWQSVYSELFFTDTNWPAFTKEEFLTILDEFSKRDRRMGK